MSNLDDAARSGAAPRALAARAISAVLDEGRSLDVALAQIPAAWPPADRALAAAIAYGVLRDYRWLKAALAPRLARPPQPRLRALLLVGLYQLESMRIPPHAAVHATVTAAADLKLGKARGMVNAILRGHQRDGAPEVSHAPGVAFSHPDWLVEAIRRDWPDGWQTVLAANNSPAPMHVRVNTRIIGRDTYRRALEAAAIKATPIPGCEAGLTLAEPVAAQTLPGYAAGEVSVQDGAAQLVGELLAPRDRQRVLDACAAPGNKSALLLERAAIDLLALDIDVARRKTLEQTLARLRLTARTAVADAGDIADWWDGMPFDRILLDAPCSGTGVIRRHPDIKWLRRATDIAAAAERQGLLLRALWRTLAPGGRLVYATCSLLRAEGVDVVAAFLAEYGDACERIIEGGWGAPERFGRRIAPGQHGFDGFYYAVLERRQ